MSAYDMHIGKLIRGRRDLEGGGMYLLCTPDKTIVEVDSLQANDVNVVTSKDLEDALYEFCLSALDHYVSEGTTRISMLFPFTPIRITAVTSYTSTISKVWPKAWSMPSNMNGSGIRSEGMTGSGSSFIMN